MTVITLNSNKMKRYEFIPIRVITKLPNFEQSSKGKSKLISIQTEKISIQPENCENCNDPELVQAFPKKWWVESDFTALNLPLRKQTEGTIERHWPGNIGCTR